MHYIIEVENVVGEKGILQHAVDSYNKVEISTTSIPDLAYRFSMNHMLSQMVLLADRLEIKSATFKRMEG